jgi:hypothetical protein
MATVTSARSTVPEAAEMAAIRGRTLALVGEAPGPGMPCSLPVTWKAFDTVTCTSPPELRMTWTT